MVVIDGSTDGSAAPLRELARREPQLMLIELAGNSGKGAAVLAGVREAKRRGFTHALVMDADGQHPAESIAEFMAESRRHPDALVLGRPVFPANIPRERLHGRKLSVGMVRLEILGDDLGDPLFGFRVYPIAPLLDALANRRSGRRYDFDTDAAVRMFWAGTPAVHLAAPVRYFSREEGGVSHFHYLRDNITMVRLHARLVAELVLWRWPAILRLRRSRRRTARRSALGLAALLVFAAAFSGSGLRAAAGDAAMAPEQPIPAGAQAWRDLAEQFARMPDTFADFTEKRHFPFKKDPVVLTGVVRVSAKHGLSLHYERPEERTVIVDDAGVLIRDGRGERAAPSEPHAMAANRAMLNVLRLDLDALAADFELYGNRDGESWTVRLVPKTTLLKRATGQITVSGVGTGVHQIVLRRSAKQYIEIEMDQPETKSEFAPDVIERYFRERAGETRDQGSGTRD